MYISSLTQNLGYVSQHNFRNRNRIKVNRTYGLIGTLKKIASFVIDAPNRISQPLRKELWW